MLFKKTLLTLMALFMSASGMPVYAEEAPAPEVTETDKKLVPETGTASVLGIKKLYAEENIASGTWGTCPWTIDANGVLTIGAGTGSSLTYLATPPWSPYAEKITSVKTSGKVVFPENCYGLFDRLSNCTSFSLLNVDTGNVEYMNSVFTRCTALESLDVSSWDVSEVKDFYGMFGWNPNLIELDLSGWDTSSAVRTARMFWTDSKLSRIYVGDGWNMDGVPYAEKDDRLQNKTSSGMFASTTSLPNFSYNSETDKTHANTDPETGYLTYKVNLGAFRYLANSSFVLSGTSDYGTPINMVVVSSRSGRMSFKNVEKGTYTLTEVSPTDGYIKNSVRYTVTITDSGVSVTPDNADYYYENSDQKVLFNEAYHAFTIQKASSTDSTVGVAGAKFLLSGVSDYGTEVSQTQTTGSTGIATFDHLEAGNYLLTETKAPEHYALDPISRVVSINKYGTVKIDGLSKEGSSFVWTDIRNADGTVTITKKWNDTLTGTNAEGRTLPSIVISTQRTIPDAVTVIYNAKDGYFGTDPANKENEVKYSEVVDQNGNILSVTASKGEEKTPSLSGKTFDAWYLDAALTNKAPDSIADYIKENSKVQTIPLYAKYNGPPTLTAGTMFNMVIKTLAAGRSRSIFYTDSLIQSVQVVNALPSDSTPTKDVSANNDGSYIAWWDADTSTIKLYSSSGDVILNPNSGSMFSGCSGLTTLDLSNWDTSQVTSTNEMFYNCQKLTTLDLSGWDTSQVTDMRKMFCKCSVLTTLKISNWNTSQVTRMGGIFLNCSGLTSLNVSGWNTSQVTDMSSMFYGCSGLTTLDVSNWDTSRATDMSSMFYGCSGLTPLDVSNWDTSLVTNMNSMFNSCLSLTALDVSKWDTSKVTNMGNMFRGCDILTTLDVSSWDTGKVTNMYNMFSICSSLTAIYFGSKWSTSQVANMGNMFQGCSRLTSLAVSNWDTSKVTDMNSMFKDCSRLTTLDVSGWNTSLVTNMNSMFNYCERLTALDVSHWKTSNVTNMGSMFSGCSNLITLDTSMWNTSQVKNMNSMFADCGSLTAIDASNWDTSQVTNMAYMFVGCSSIKSIYIGNSWNTDKVTDSRGMFLNCTNLHNFSPTVVDKTKANAGAGGYMTLKS